MQPPMEYPYINREISWLSFNDRVLQEATDPENPVMERLKFLGIFSSNLDEFFRVRVATMKRLLALGDRAQELISADPKVILEVIRNRVMRQQARFEKIYAAVLEELAEAGIFLVDQTTLDEAQQKFVVEYFRSTVRPALVPVMLDQIASAPRVNDGMIYFAILMRNSKNPSDEQRAVMKIPTADTIPRFLVLPSAPDRHCIILLDDIIRFCLSEIFALFEYDYFAAYTFKVTRDAELDLEDKVMISYIETLSESLKERKRGKPVRMVYDREMPLELLEALDDKLEWSDELTKIPSGRYHNFKDFMGFPKVGEKSLYFEPFPPIPHPALPPRQSIMRVIRERDIVLHFPYQPFYHVIDLLREAAIDPKVTSIKMTLYRLASNSNVANALINAVRNGKEVVVVIELQARFDEKANISWARKFKDNNVRVIYGVPGLKVHSKLLHITRSEGDTSVCYSGIGTGNFNESTAKVYSDDILLTADPRISGDVAEVFRFLEDNAYDPQPKHLLMAPFTMRPRFEALLQREVDNARLGKEAWCSLKLNSLVDREMVKLLYEAGQAGVKIRLIIRGICSLVPGKRGVSENIQAISIVDRFLEHSRLFFFANGGNPEAFMGSADWMRRNLSNRVEVITPIYDSTLRQELYEMFELQWNDNTKARLLSGRQENRYRGTAKKNCRRAQYDIYRYIVEKKSTFGGESSVKLAAIDIGSNAMRLLIANAYERNGSGANIKKGALYRIPLRLGDDAFLQGVISPAKVNDLIKTMIAYRNIMEVSKVEGYMACATSALRDAANREEVVKRVALESGVHIEVISGAREAEIIALNSSSAISPSGSFLYIDVGGGSTELTYYRDGVRVISRSFDIGTVRLLNNLVPDERWKELRDWLRQTVADDKSIQAIGSGGNINKIYKLTRPKEGHPLSQEKLAETVKMLSALTMDERMKQLGLREDRADVIVPAGQIVLSILRWGKIRRIIVPKIGLSDGIVAMLYQERIQCQG